MAAALPFLPYIAAGASVASAAVSYGQSRQQAGMARIQADQARIQARQAELAAQGEEVQGQSKALDLRESLLRTLAAQRTRYAAAGVLLDDGTPATLAEDASRAAERQLAITDTQTRINAASRRLGVAGTTIRAGLLDDQADSLAATGAVSAGLQATQGAVNLFSTLPGSTKGTTKTTKPERLTGRIAGPI